MSPRRDSFTTMSATITGGSREDRDELARRIEHQARTAATRVGLRIQFTNDEAEYGQPPHEDTKP